MRRTMIARLRFPDGSPAVLDLVPVIIDRRGDPAPVDPGSGLGRDLFGYLRRISRRERLDVRFEVQEPDAWSSMPRIVARPQRNES
jgi:hypothetical protein